MDTSIDDRPLRMPESAGYHLLHNVPSAHPDESCAEVLAALRDRRFENADTIVVTDAQERVLGMVSAGELATTAGVTPVHQIMHRSIAVATLDTDQEQVASLAIGNVLGAVPIVDEGRKFVGLVPPQALLSVLRREHVEDIHRLAGILRESAIARAAIEGPPARRATHRLPWLFVGLAGSAVAALIMARFEAVLQARVAIIFFLPGIVYLADAIGTQTEAIAVRGLSLSHVGMRHLLARELWTGLLIGTILGMTSVLGIWVILQDLRLALAVGSALIAAGGIATGIGLLLPWLFQRVGLDPAYGSGPLATVTQDVLSLLVYFASVSVFFDIGA